MAVKRPRRSKRAAAPPPRAAGRKVTAPAKKKQSARAKKKPSPGARAAVTKRAPPRPRRPAATEPQIVSWWEEFYRVVRLIPRGRVTTYGTVALLGGHPRAARHVGFAMAALKYPGKNGDVPWQRVLAAAPRQRACVVIRDPVGGAMQRAMLEAEGVTFDAKGRTHLGTFGWSGPGEGAGSRRRRGP